RAFPLSFSVSVDLDQRALDRDACRSELDRAGTGLQGQGDPRVDGDGRSGVDAQFGTARLGCGGPRLEGEFGSRFGGEGTTHLGAGVARDGLISIAADAK